MFTLRTFIKISLVLFATFARAESSINTISISLNIISHAALDANGFTGFSGSGVSYSLGSAPLINVALGSIAVNFPLGIAYKVGIGKGLHNINGVRQMAFNGAAFIPYTLFYNGMEWGDKGLRDLDNNYIETTPTINAVSSVGTGNTEQFNISGDAQLQNATIAGIYTDTLTVALVW